MIRPLSATELLDLWEQGRSQPSFQQALLLLAAACPDTVVETLAQLPIGRRDGLLLGLREWTFGSQIQGVVDCPSCGERLEFELDVAALRLHPAVEPSEPLDFEAAGYRVRWRPPTSVDLAAAAEQPSLAAARQTLLARCLVEVTPPAGAADGSATHPPLGGAPLPAAVLDALNEQLGAADPQADIDLAFTCPACGNRWTALFDVATFFWQEIDNWAQRTLREVHLLASTYGWSESEILSMSAWRRQAYLEMVSE
jgi:hypothetical protein